MAEFATIVAEKNAKDLENAAKYINTVSWTIDDGPLQNVLYRLERLFLVSARGKKPALKRAKRKLLALAAVDMSKSADVTALKVIDFTRTSLKIARSVGS